MPPIPQPVLYKYPQSLGPINEISDPIPVTAFFPSSFVRCGLPLNPLWISACFDRPPSRFCGCASRSAGATTGKAGLASQTNPYHRHAVSPRMCNTWRMSTDRPERGRRYPLWLLSSTDIVLTSSIIQQVPSLASPECVLLSHFVYYHLDANGYDTLCTHSWAGWLCWLHNTT